MIKKFTQSISSNASLYATKWLLVLGLPFLACQVANAQLPYVATACADPYVVAQGQAGTTLIGTGDDVQFTVALPFTFAFYGINYTQIRVSTNGFIVFQPGTDRGLGNVALPTATAGAALYPFWDDLIASAVAAPLSGVYQRVDGVAPNRIFTIEWFEIGHFAAVAGQHITFQTRLFENGNRIQFKYLDVVFGGSQSGFDNGLSATVGLEGELPAPRPFTQVGFNSNFLTNGQCIEFVQPAACIPIAGPTQNVGTTLGTCVGSATVAIPTFNPAGCADGTSVGLRYSVNGGPFIVVPLPAANVTITGLPKGTNVITWQTFVISNNATSGTATQIINVADNEPPVIVCPSNVTINLPPGACTALFSYIVQATDNCPVTADASVANLITADPGFGQAGHMFTVENLQPFPITINSFDFNIRPGLASITVEVWATTTATTHVGNQTNQAAWTKIGPNQVLNAPFVLLNLRNVSAAPGIVIPANSSRGIYVTSQQFFAGGPLVAQMGQTGFIQDANIRINKTTGNLVNYPFGTPNVFPDFIFSGRVNYSFAVDPLSLIAGLPSGSEFPIGTTTNIWKATDLAGNMSTCSFTVTVNEFPNPITSLVCNDWVNVSLDASCTMTLNADQILEGGPYGCYNDYIVQLDKVPPFGNGPWVPGVLGPQDIGKTYAVRVVDPETGNSCWGNLLVEDKLAPVLVCTNKTVACNSDLNPAAPSVPITASGSANFSILDATTTTTNINIPASATITDVNVVFRTNHTWVGDISARLTSPSGTVVQLFDRPGVPATALGCANDGIDVVFDDQATLTAAQFENTCNATPPAIGPGTYRSIDPLANFNGQNASGTWVLTVVDAVGGDAGPVSFVQINIAGVSQSPGFPNNLQLNVNVFPAGGGNYVVPAGAGSPALENCSDVTLSYLDTEVAQDCASGLTKRVNRKWTAVDASGNTKTCLQVISLQRPNLSDVVFPPDYDDVDAPALPCTAGYPTPQYIQGLGLQGSPTVFGSSDGCTINWTYIDTRIDICDGTYKVLREWKVIDWCVGQFLLHNQIIKVLDKTGPAISCPADLTVSTDPFSCCAIVNLPDVIIRDNCSRINNIGGMIIGIDPFTLDTIGMFPIGGQLTNFPGNNLWDLDTLGAFGLTPCLPAGTHTVIYQAEDDCGNTSTCSFRLTVRDYVPPVAACTEFTVVSIGVDDPYDCYGPGGFLGVPPALGDCEFGGVTWVKASTFDQGSYDNCNNIKFTIQRMAPYSDCINSLNSINGFLPCDDQFPDFPSEFERAVAEQDSIKFYCCEVGTTQTVILRVYQLDAFGNFAIGPDGTPIHNTCMIDVLVQDKIKPVCISPANVTVSCEAFDPSLWAYGKPTVQDNCCLDENRVYQGQCGLEHSASYALFDTLCNRGTITRTFRVYDCHGQSTQCTQRIVVTYEQDYWIRFPNDVIVTVCDGTGNYGAPTFNGAQDCELLGVSFEDQVFTVVPDACFKIERTWTIINWCTYNPNANCVTVPNPEPNATANSPQNLTGPTVSPCGTPAPWAPTNVAIAPGQAPTNFCTFWSATANCYRYKQIIKIIDNQKPTVDCPASPVEYCDLSANDPLLWNQSYWWDGVSHDLCEGDAPLSITATDACSGANVNITYLLFLDLDGDGSMETVVSSNNPPAPGTVNYNNLGTPNYSGGTPRVFDGRPVPAAQVYRWAVHYTTSGTSRTAAVQWKTQAQLPTPANPNGTSGVVPQLPYGTHKIKWTISDGCGNEETCEYHFVVKDCKAPTVVCLHGLSVNIMPTKMITLWASDFLQYGEDNCTPSNLLKYGIRKAGQGTGFPVDAQGNPITSVTFTCAELGQQPVELWVQDLAGNADFCLTYLDVQDNAGNCGNNNINVAGALKTEDAQGLEDANVNLQSGAMSHFAMTDADGKYQFNGLVAQNAPYTVTPTKDDNPLNGVSTFDLVLISKHILGLEPLNSPYKMIAADANKSNSITTFDIVELRKLILGIYTELPNNTSWRFVDKSFAFPNQANPFQTQFPEIKTVSGSAVDQLNEDFVAVKVGDVNGTAIPSSLLSGDDRTAGTLLFDVDDRELRAGELATVTFRAAERVQGWQFTLNLSGLEVASIEEGEKVRASNFGVFADALTTSVDGDAAEFSVTFRAVKAGRLSEMLGVSSRITRAEAYSLSSDRMEVALRFNGAGGATIAGVGFELYQNQPNPFVNKTVIGFHLPEAADATLTVFDESGRLLFVQKGSFAKGHNAIAVDRALLGTSGLMYYKLETSTDSATKKMVQTK
ncbi:MAG: HYR domain-containing protein [Saprospiraceae bacterium]|nr:HYR domain-containing protein [Saprospiraceae bacterium]